jgi:hypothetical protein
MTKQLQAFLKDESGATAIRVWPYRIRHCRCDH